MMRQKPRCHWPGDDPLYQSYHDTEWGVPEYDPRALYEKLVLDGFQAGLSWITILRKRENFRKAFHNFDPHRIAPADHIVTTPRLRVLSLQHDPRVDGEHALPAASAAGHDEHARLWNG